MSAADVKANDALSYDVTERILAGEHYPFGRGEGPARLYEEEQERQWYDVFLDAIWSRTSGIVMLVLIAAVMFAIVIHQTVVWISQGFLFVGVAATLVTFGALVSCIVAAIAMDWGRPRA